VPFTLRSLLPVLHSLAGVLYVGQGILPALPNDTMMSFASCSFIVCQSIKQLEKLPQPLQQL
jgi:hypothetical protein